MKQFLPFEQKMRSVGLGDAAIGAFHRCFDTLVTNQSGMIPESSILPASDVTNWDDIMSGTTPASADIISQSVCIKLNGGLGTSMGLQKAKSLLPVKGDLTFLDLIVKQVKHLRDISGTPVRLLLMNSFSTSKDTLAYLEKYAKDGFNNPAEMELMQNRVPKILQDSLTPATWAQNPDQEWCPPGHGDIYPALLGSGWLDRLLADGVKYAFISNADNLGAQIDLRFLRWFAESGAPFVMEVTRRTEADKKGGHLAIRRSDGQLILREVAQCPDDDLPQFQSINEHRFFNTNSLWIRLDDLRGILNKNDGVLPLPTIRNNKTIDPRDPSSPAVYQLETAMGAGIECFPGAKAVNVPRSRFFPVKTTSDLLLLRSDAINIDQEGKVSLAPSRNGIAPIVNLDPKCYKLVDSLDSLGVPSLIKVDKLSVQGKVHFPDGIALKGTVILVNDSEKTMTVSL
ncbi:MAG: UTP--glucose-1-phosphate uridylyltransferase [Akkermansia sp.]